VTGDTAGGQLLLLTRDDIRRAYDAIRPYLRRTPVITLDLAGPATLKLEQLQCAGSFKARGAFANLLLRDVPPAGVAAASGGNHGVAVAYAAHQLGIPARIFVPTVSSPAKVERIRQLADLVIAGDRYADALEAAQRWAAVSGAMSVPAYDHRETILGQATLALELDDQARPLDTVLVPVGGGGLIAGIASYFAGTVRVIGVEPDGAPTLARARAAGAPVDAPAGSIAVDALAPRRVGDLVFPITQAYVEDVVLVDDDAIRGAQRTLWQTARIAAEPAAAVGVAALLTGAYKPAPGERVAVIVSGANMTPMQLDDCQLVDRDLGFYLDRKAQGQFRDADRGPGVGTRLRAPQVQDEVGEAVDHRRRPGEPGCHVHHPEHAQPAGDPVQVPQGTMQARQHRQGRQPGPFVGVGF
jgi:threonine dehydratase